MGLVSSLSGSIGVAVCQWGVWDARVGLNLALQANYRHQSHWLTDGETRAIDRSVYSDISGIRFLCNPT